MRSNDGVIFQFLGDVAAACSRLLMGVIANACGEHCERLWGECSFAFIFLPSIVAAEIREEDRFFVAEVATGRADGMSCLHCAMP